MLNYNYIMSMVDSIRNDWNRIQDIVFDWYEALRETTLFGRSAELIHWPTISYHPQ